MTGTAADVLARCSSLGEISEEPDGLTRRFATPALARAGELVAGWMEDAGMTTRRDAVGNVIGRHAGGERPLVLGSHLDTVPNAGTFDGPLGVVAAIAVVERLAAGGAQPSRPVEVVAFADEEGTRFGTSFLGSSAYVGAFESAWLDHVDGEGITLRDTLRALGGEPELALDASAPALSGYLELHIEQGPVLEREGLPVGVVTAIAGQTRARIVLTGEAGHAGTLPMDARHDALAAAAEAVLAVERRARAEPGLVATVGALSLSPNVGNVVPGEVRMLLDMRHADDGVRRRAAAEVRADVEGIAATRGVDAAWMTRYDTPAAVLDATLRARLADALRVQGIPACDLVSGAGHDAVVLSRICPAAMLFVRCAGGISHDPRESVSEEDVAVALDVLEHAVRAS